MWMEMSGGVPSYSGSPRPSRHEDIFKGLAKVKALEAAKKLTKVKSNK